MKKILIIEDEPDVASSIKMYLENEGYSVEFTLDAEEGLGKLEGFDLLLLDLIMPKVSGRSVLKELKRRKIKTPVIVLTAVGLPQTVFEELSSLYPGIQLIPKTKMYAELIPAIKALIGPQ